MRAPYSFPLLLALGACIAPASAGNTAGLVLDNATVRLEATPAFGGRILSWHLQGEPNVLKIGEDAIRSQPLPAWSAQAGDIPYLGHDVWVGPQSQWWLHQDVNPQRRQAAANWPPDPYLSLATVRVRSRDARQFTLDGVDSPVTGVRLRKQVRLDDAAPDTVWIEAEARNVRDSPIAWDLWFNTRVAADTRVFVPVRDPEHDIDLQASTDDGTTAPRHAWNEGLFVLTAQSADSPLIQRGKYRLQPSAGWMAGFAGHQMLLIRFEHQPRERIHPEQGQVELYLDAPSYARAQGLMEMEVHAPYRQLAPGERMRAAERWTLLRYDGPDELKAQRDFLCQHAARLSLEGACLP
jgi:hypothetical protein